MKIELFGLFLLLGIVVAVDTDKVLENFEDRCTTIILGAKAGSEGPMNTHTADCADCDFRIGKVPAMDWPEDSLRPLYQYQGNYPATVTSSRGKTWHPDNLEGTAEQITAWGKESIITGYIPQVKHTYALFEAGYGIMNEHQVAIGESTCSARFWAAPTSAGGAARIEARELSKLALERTTTARDAILLMGELAETYGFYAADWSGGDTSMGEGGEALTVVDKTEAWVFHVLSDDTGTSAVWVAKRVPDNHASAVANAFVIRDIDPDSADNLYSSNIFEIAERNNLWSKKSGEKLDFTKVYGVPRAHSVYATRRVWRVFNLVAPSIELPTETDYYGSDYPFSVPVDKVLTPQEVMDIQRDHYEGTQFDLTKGLAAGPYGDPNRFDMAATGDLTMTDVLGGSYERAISLFRTSYSFVSQARAAVPDQLALLWFAPGAPATTSYTPLYLITEELPEQYTRGSLFKYDNTVAFWNFCAAGNYAARFWMYAMEAVRACQSSLMARHLSAKKETEEKVLKLINSDPNNMSSSTEKEVIEILTQFTDEQAADVLSSWQNLLPELITVYHDGYIASNLDQAKILMKKVFYPPSWLDATGYWDNPPNYGPGVIQFEPNPIDTNAASSSLGAIFFTAIFSSLATLLGGAYYLRAKGVQLPAAGAKAGYNSLSRNDYVSINL